MWKILKECTRYEINEYGEIRNLETKVLRTSTVNNRGYKVLSFTLDDGKRKMFQVHRLVASNFLPEPSQEIVDGYINLKSKIIQVDHMNRNRVDNHVSNLRWCTPTQNIGNTVGHVASERGVNSRFSSINQEQLDELISAYNSGTLDTKVFSEKYGIDISTINKHLRKVGISRTGGTRPKLSSEDVTFIKTHYTKKGEYNAEALSERFNVSTTTIHKALRS